MKRMVQIIEGKRKVTETCKDGYSDAMDGKKIASKAPFEGRFICSLFKLSWVVESILT